MYLSKIAEKDWKYPQGKANASGHLAVSGNPKHEMYWEEYGNPKGEPVLVVHGGPGGACDPSYARFFDPKRYRIVLFDQRGCGKSRPSASDADPKPALTANTTDDLIGDMVKLRAHLGIKGKAHLFGGSWGSTLSLAYAVKHPDTVASLNLRGIFLCRKPDIDFFYQGNAAEYDKNPRGLDIPGTYQVFPEPWKAFVETIPPEKRGDMVKAYAEIFAAEPKTQSQRDYQDKAAIAWSVWEGSTSNLSLGKVDLDKYADPEFAKAFAKIENHYFMNGGFLGGSGEKNRENNYLIENAPILKDIPISIVHGRYDQVCPLNQAEALVDALKAAGVKSLDYRITPAGHSMMERETHRELTDIMDTLPPLSHVEKAHNTGTGKSL